MTDGGHPPPLSAQNPRARRARRLLRDARLRRTERAYVVEGPGLVGEALACGCDVAEVFVGTVAATGEVVPRARQVWASAQAAGVAVFGLDVDALRSIASTDTPQPALAVIRRPDPLPDPLPGILAGQTGAPALVLRLVALGDPGNAGTLVRSAEAAGAQAVVFEGGVDPTNPKVLRASAGSALRLPIVVHDADSAARHRRHRRQSLVASIGLVASGGRPPEQCDLGAATELVVGNEAGGLPAGVVATLDDLVTIPMAEGVESLNAAMAGTVVLFEAARQRRAAQGAIP